MVPTSSSVPGGHFNRSLWHMPQHEPALLHAIHNPAAFQTAASALEPGMRLGRCPLALPDISPAGFQSRRSAGSSSLCRFPGFGSLMWGSDPLFLREGLCTCDVPPASGLLCQGHVSWADWVSASLTHVCIYRPFYWSSLCSQRPLFSV